MGGKNIRKEDGENYGGKLAGETWRELAHSGQLMKENEGYHQRQNKMDGAKRKR